MGASCKVLGGMEAPLSTHNLVPLHRAVQATQGDFFFSRKTVKADPEPREESYQYRGQRCDAPAKVCPVQLAV